MKMIQDDPPPLNMLNISKDLLSIISLCLEKDPSKRITWDELLNNPYWGLEGKELFDSLILPQEPQFEEYLAKYGKKKKIFEIEKKPDFKRYLHMHYFIERLNKTDYSTTRQHY